MIIKKIINLKKYWQSNTIKDAKELSLGSLYFVGSPIKLGGIIAMPVSMKQDVILLYLIALYKYDVLKSSNKSIVIFPSKIKGLFARFFSIKINKKAANMILRSFAIGGAPIENVVTVKIKKMYIEFMDNVAIVDGRNVPGLKLHLIKRIININEWPAIAIKKWAIYHLKLEKDSINYIYNNRLISDRKILVNTIQKYHTRDANRIKQERDNQQKAEYMEGYMEGGRLTLLNGTTIDSDGNVTDTDGDIIGTDFGYSIMTNMNKMSKIRPKSNLDLAKFRAVDRSITRINISNHSEDEDIPF